MSISAKFGYSVGQQIYKGEDEAKDNFLRFFCTCICHFHMCYGKCYKGQNLLLSLIS